MPAARRSPEPRAVGSSRSRAAATSRTRATRSRSTWRFATSSGDSSDSSDSGVHRDRRRAGSIVGQWTRPAAGRGRDGHGAGRRADRLRGLRNRGSADRVPALGGLCSDGGWRAIRYAVEQPDRVLGIVAFAVGVPRLTPPHPHYVTATAAFEDDAPTHEGWARYNAPFWRHDYPDFARFFFEEI